MLYANDTVGGRVKASPKARATCPTCNSQMIAKCGRTVVWHWAHEATDECDPWSEGETLWHAAWKSRFADSEVTIRRPVGGVETSHRADAVTPRGTVIEFQHSTISAEDIEDREWFYRDMVWVLDATDAFRRSRIELDHHSPDQGSPYCNFVWMRRRRSFDGASATVFLDLGVAFRDVGKPFHKAAAWWDDEDGGLRDGLRRAPGIWQRIEIAPLLIEIKKRSEAAGWGHAMTHSEFCRRFGGACSRDERRTKSLRMVSGPDCFVYGKRCQYISFDRCSEDRAAYGRPYQWCEEELKEGVTT